MASIHVTGDMHQEEMRRLNVKRFPEQREMTDGQDFNFVIICGDFSFVWSRHGESKKEKYWLDWLENKPFTTLWVDGNHENFDRLYSDEYPIEEWHGGMVQKIRPHVIRLLRGECYEILGKRFFAFGGASSHDIEDGILDPIKDKALIRAWRKEYQEGFKQRHYRVNHVSWWEQEIATEEEMQHGRDTLAKMDNSVDFIITHCLPQEVCYMLSLGGYKPDPMTMYFNEIAKNVSFKRWICGHYHIDERVMMKFDVMYRNIMRIV